jgi:hypothetical protein
MWCSFLAFMRWAGWDDPCFRVKVDFVPRDTAYLSGSGGREDSQFQCARRNPVAATKFGHLLPSGKEVEGRKG